MNSIIKWGLLILALYLVWKWWQSQQTAIAQPAWTPGLTGSVYGGGILTAPSSVGPNYAPYSSMNPYSTLYGSGNPGYFGGYPGGSPGGPGVVGPVVYNPTQGTVYPVPFQPGQTTQLPIVTNPVTYLGLINRPVGNPVLPPFGSVTR